MKNLFVPITIMPGKSGKSMASAGMTRMALGKNMSKASRQMSKGLRKADNSSVWEQITNAARQASDYASPYMQQASDYASPYMQQASDYAAPYVQNAKNNTRRAIQSVKSGYYGSVLPELALLQNEWKKGGPAQSGLIESAPVDSTGRTITVPTYTMGDIGNRLKTFGLPSRVKQNQYNDITDRERSFAPLRALGEYLSPTPNYGMAMTGPAGLPRNYRTSLRDTMSVSPETVIGGAGTPRIGGELTRRYSDADIRRMMAPAKAKNEYTVQGKAVKPRNQIWNTGTMSPDVNPFETFVAPKPQPTYNRAKGRWDTNIPSNVAEPVSEYERKQKAPRRDVVRMAPAQPTLTGLVTNQNYINMGKRMGKRMSKANNPTPTPTPYTRRIAGENGAMIGARSGVKSQNRQDAELFGSNMKQIGAGALDMLMQGGKLAGGALMMLPPALYGAYKEYTKPGRPSSPIVNAIRSGGRVAARVGGKMLADTWNDYTTGKNAIYYPEITIRSTKIGTPQGGLNPSMRKGMSGMCKCGSGMSKSMCKCGGMGKSMTKRASIRKGRFTNAARAIFGGMRTAAGGIKSGMGRMRVGYGNAVDALEQAASEASKADWGRVKLHGVDDITGLVTPRKGVRGGVYIKPGSFSRMRNLTQDVPALDYVPSGPLPSDATMIYDPSSLGGKLAQWMTRKQYQRDVRRQAKEVRDFAYGITPDVSRMAEIQQMKQQIALEEAQLAASLSAKAPNLDRMEAERAKSIANAERDVYTNYGRIRNAAKWGKRAAVIGGIGAGIAGGMALANSGRPSGSTSPTPTTMGAMSPTPMAVSARRKMYGMNGSGRASMLNASRPSQYSPSRPSRAKAMVMGKSLYKGPLPPTNMTSKNPMSMGNSGGMGSMGMNNSGGMGMGGSMSYKRMGNSMAKRDTPTKAQSPSNKYL